MPIIVGMDTNQLYYGDNLDVLRRYIADESADLVYLDPPFKSNQDYNVLFQEQNGSRSASQIKAFEDTWRWDQAAAAAFEEVVEGPHEQVSRALQAFRTFLGENDMLAYLCMMAPRLIELRRVLKPTGSIYLHCDPTASHYLKMLMDGVFGGANFRNEIVWKRTSSHSDAKNYGCVYDSLMYYMKERGTVWNEQYVPYSQAHIESAYRHIDEHGRRYATRDMRSPHPRPNLTYEYKGYKPHANGWTVSPEVMERLDAEGRLHFPRSKEGRIRLRVYLDEMPGVKLGNMWDDIPPINSQAAERLGYPTQKPEALLERIINASSNEGDVVLDPFCGCGTAVAVAQKLKRSWIGIDITHLAIALIKYRLRDSFGEEAKFDIVGEPVSVPDAKALAEEDPYQFQWWALSLVNARPVEQKKGADKGIDGRIYFHDDPEAKRAETKQVVLSVKAGKTGVAHVRDLRGVVEREDAAIGVLISMQTPTKAMAQEAASAGFYKSGWGPRYPRLQLLTIEGLLQGKSIQMPPRKYVDRTFKKAPRTKPKGPATPDLPFGSG